MNQADVDILVHNAPLPPGYVLRVTPQRKHPLRSLWAVRVFRDGERLFGRAYYNPAQGIVEAQRWAWDAVPLTVTTDADGYIKSMEPTE